MKKVTIVTGEMCGAYPVRIGLGTVLISFPETGGPSASLMRFTYALLQQDDVVVLTRYPEIINYAGELIYRKYLDPENVKVVIAGREGSKSYAFDGEGVMRDDWPFGYFIPSHDELNRILGLEK